MATYSPRHFSHPEVLKTIHPKHLLALLEPHDEFFAKRGVSLPLDAGESPGDGIDYKALVHVFMTPDDDTPVPLNDALYLINEMTSTEGMDALLDAVRERGLRLDGDADRTPADVAVQVWLKDPDLMQRKHAELNLLVRPRSYTTYRSMLQPPPPYRPPGDAAIHALESELGRAFDQMGRSSSCRVLLFPQAEDLWILVGHGDPYRREGTLAAGGRSTQVFYRPERFDVLIYGVRSGELRINARSAKELELYRVQVGHHLFGEAEFFKRADVYTLQPIRDDGERCLACTDVPGLEWIKLVGLRFLWPGEPSITVDWRSDHLFFAVKQREREFPSRLPLLSATFQIKFTDGGRPRSLTVRPPRNTSYMRDEDSVCVEEWLRLRGFVVRKEQIQDATAGAVLAHA